MTAKNEISEELKGLSEVVAGISRSLPYEGPDAAYFENLSAQVLMRLGMGAENGGDSAFSTVLQGIVKGSDFSVPEGYFDNFASKMLDKVRASEAVGLAARSEAAGTEAFGIAARSETVGIEEELAELSPLLRGIGREMPYSVPAGYFEELPVVGAMLDGVKKNETYRVPVDYFEGLASTVLSRVKAGSAFAETVLDGAEALVQPAKVVTMSGAGRKTGLRWLKYASMGVAASVLLVVGWLSLNHPVISKGATAETSNADISNKLAKVSDQDIQNYLEVQHPSLDEELANSTAALDISDNDLYSMLDQVSDAELKEYMEDHGNDKDLPTN
jgi:hypothetical protein